MCAINEYSCNSCQNAAILIMEVKTLWLGKPQYFARAEKKLWMTK